MNLDEMIKDVERRGYHWLARSVNKDVEGFRGAYFVHIRGEKLNADFEYQESWMEIDDDLHVAFSQAYNAFYEEVTREE